MASMNMDFDPRAVEPDAGPKGGGVIPEEGPFEFELIESDVTPTRDGTGQKLEVVAECLTEPYRGRKVFDSINIVNKSAQAQAIGQGQLSALCRAAGFADKLEDSEQLHHRPFWAKLKIEEYFSNKHQRQMQKNVFKQFMFDGCEDGASANPPEQKAQAQQSAPRQAPANTSAGAPSRPWLKK